MLGLTWLGGLLRNRLGRLLAAGAGVAVAVALLASIGSFLSASKASMTARSAGITAVDWQVQVSAGADAGAVAEAVAQSAGVITALPVAFATTTGLQATVAGSAQVTGPGLVLGLAGGYRAAFAGELRSLIGDPDGVVLAQQTAANLHARPGDMVSIGRAGMAPAVVRLDGVVDLPQADSLFQKVGAPAGAQPQAPPDNIVLMPTGVWHQLFDPLATARPDQTYSQVHVRLSRHLPTDPSAAYTTVTGMAHNLESRLAGTGRVGDNLGASLAAARSDALYAQVLFLFLGLPGAVLAGLLTAAVTASGADRRRREQGLLRARGASNSQLSRIALTEAATVGGLGGVAGLLLALGVGALAFSAPGFGATTGSAVTVAVGALVVGMGIATAAIVVPARRDARQLTVSAARQAVGRVRSPSWLRWGLDLLALAGSAVVFWLTGRGGYHLVLAPEGVPTISVNYWAFAGPALLWTGAGLLAWRLADLLLGRGRKLTTRLIRPLGGPLSATVTATMARQRRLLARALVVVSLTVSFAASTAVFNATYRQQTEVDARLTNGADVAVTRPPGSAASPGLPAQLAAVAGVRSVEPLQHRFAYVGADLQDLFGVRPATVARATKLQNAYFSGGTAAQLMSRLSAEPSGVLVSAETAKDFQLHLGDRVILRLQDARTKQYAPVDFRYVGVAKEFPTAPHDSFLVVNAAYVARMTGDDSASTFLVDSRGSPAGTAEHIRAAFGPVVQVNDIGSSRKTIGSSLTAVDLAGLTRVELGFALVLAAAATGLALALGLVERRRMFAIAAALGAKPRQLGAFVWAEAIVVSVGGLLCGAVSGWALSEMLVKVLTGVFDPPPAALAIPWTYLGLVVAAAATAVVIAANRVIASARQPAMAILRDL